MAARCVIRGLRHLSIRSQIHADFTRISTIAFTNLNSSFMHKQCQCQTFTGLNQSNKLHTSSVRRDLSDFLDKEDNWAKETVPVGRPWHLDELRIKCNEDLHKLWYVLLKERNMLLTMEAEYKRLVAVFPSPERIDKVEESMENLLAVVKERDDAVNILESGSTGRPNLRIVRNFFGLKEKRIPEEHDVPMHMNDHYNLLHPPYRKSMVPYIKLYNEKQRHYRQQERNRQRRTRKALKKAFPHMEETN